MTDIENYNLAVSKYYDKDYKRMEVSMTIGNGIYRVNLNKFICKITSLAKIPGLVCELIKEIDELIRSFVRENYEKINSRDCYCIPTYNFDHSRLNEDNNIREAVHGVMKLCYSDYRSFQSVSMQTLA